MKSKITENQIIQALRLKSEDSMPAKDFASTLKTSLDLASNKRQRFSFFRSKNFAILSSFFIVFLVSFLVWNKSNLKNSETYSSLSISNEISLNLDVSNKSYSREDKNVKYSDFQDKFKYKLNNNDDMVTLDKVANIEEAQKKVRFDIKEISTIKPTPSVGSAPQSIGTEKDYSYALEPSRISNIGSISEIAISDFIVQIQYKNASNISTLYMLQTSVLPDMSNINGEEVNVRNVKGKYYQLLNSPDSLDNNLIWIEDNIFYKITAIKEFSKDDLIRIANSLN